MLTAHTRPVRNPDMQASDSGMCRKCAVAEARWKRVEVAGVDRTSGMVVQETRDASIGQAIYFAELCTVARLQLMRNVCRFETQIVAHFAGCG